MTQKDSNSGELVSALVDGELRGAAFAQAVQWLEERDDARGSWYAYHVVGDVLRSGEQAAPGANDPAFVARLRSRLEAESSVRQAGLAMNSAADGVLHQGADVSVDRKNESANDGSLRWKLVAGFASAAMVAVVGWQLVAGLGAPSGGAQLARVEVSPVQEPSQVMIRDPRLDQLLEAHQQSGAISALQMPAGFLRNATFERPAR
jgi:sigma-E factor negative regulatory protein RseA